MKNQNSTMELINTQDLSQIISKDTFKKIKDILDVCSEESFCIALNSYILGHMDGRKADKNVQYEL